MSTVASIYTTNITSMHVGSSNERAFIYPQCKTDHGTIDKAIARDHIWGQPTVTTKSNYDTSQ